jgi:hypothetical protein
MRSLAIAAALTAGVLVSNASAAWSAPRWEGLLTPEQSRAYHACLFEAWIQDYCHWTSFAYSQCLIANGGGKYPLNGRWFTEDYCWSTAQGLAPR